MPGPIITARTTTQLTVLFIWNYIHKIWRHKMTERLHFLTFTDVNSALWWASECPRRLISVASETMSLRKKTHLNQTSIHLEPPCQGLSRTTDIILKYLFYDYIKLPLHFIINDFQSARIRWKFRHTICQDLGHIHRLFGTNNILAFSFKTSVRLKFFKIQENILEMIISHLWIGSRRVLNLTTTLH